MRGLPRPDRPEAARGPVPPDGRDTDSLEMNG